MGDTGVTTKNAELPTGVDFASALRDIQAVKAAVESGEPVPDAEKEFGDSVFGFPRWRAREGGGAEDGGPVVLVMEGYLVFHPPEIAALCDCYLWLDLDMTTSLERRYSRDGPGFAERGVDREGEPPPPLRSPPELADALPPCLASPLSPSPPPGSHARCCVAQDSWRGTRTWSGSTTRCTRPSSWRMPVRAACGWTHRARWRS